MIFSRRWLTHHGPEILNPFNPEHVNPASIDICIGATYQFEGQPVKRFADTPQHPLVEVAPGQRVLVATMEAITVPLYVAVELRLKSTCARAGWNHALAFWFDPGWSGIGTMELINSNQRETLEMYAGMPIGQLIFHRLDEPVTADTAYKGRYQGAQAVEGAKCG